MLHYQTQFNPAKIFTYFLAFCFPLAGNTVEHWTSAIFVLIAIVGLVSRPWRHICLERNEKLLLYVLIGIFLAYIASGVANGWSDYQNRGWSVYLRWLLAVPIYFLVRAYPDTISALIYGAFLGLAVLIYQVYIENGFSSVRQVYGVYNSPGSIGFYALVFSSLTAVFLCKKKWMMGCTLAVISVVFGVIVIFESGSRSTYLAVLLSFFLLLGYLLVWKRNLRVFSVILVTVATISLLGYSFVPIVKHRTDLGLAEITNSFQENPSAEAYRSQSVGIRFDLWKMAVELSKRHTFFGVGWRGYSDASKPLVEEGILNKVVLSHSPHPHNAYLDILAGTGLFGAFFYFALFMLGAVRAVSNQDTLFGVFLILFAVNMINEGGSFVYNNALSFFLVFFIVLYATSASRNEAAPRVS